MKKNMKPFLNALYLSVLFYFVAQFSTPYWAFIIHKNSTDFESQIKYFYLFLTLLPFVIWGAKYTYSSVKRQTIHYFQDGKHFWIIKILFLLLIIFMYVGIELMSFEASQTHNTGMGLALEMMFMPLTLFVIPCYWIFILILLKREHGIKLGWGSLFVALFCSYFFLSTSNTCPPNKPLKDAFGKCHACDEKDPVLIMGSTYYPCQSVCSNRRENIITRECVIPKNCPSDAPMENIKDGKCYPCDTLLTLHVLDCSVCQNRAKISGRCALKECPQEHPLQDVYGGCHSCNESYSFKTLSYIEKGEDNCSICPQRYLDNHSYCSLTICPEGNPVRRPLTGDCLSCEESLHFIDESEVKKNYEEKCKE